MRATKRNPSKLAQPVAWRAFCAVSLRSSGLTPRALSNHGAQAFTRDLGRFSMARRRPMHRIEGPDLPLCVLAIDDGELAIERFAGAVLLRAPQPAVIAGAAGADGELDAADCVGRNDINRALLAGVIEVEKVTLARLQAPLAPG